jgi:hypothetical protein
VQFVPPLITPSHPDFAKVRQLVASAISKSEKSADDQASKQSKATGTSSASSSASAGSSSAGGSGSGTASDEPVDAKAVCQAVS